MVLGPFLAACEKYVYFWDESLSHSPKTQEDSPKEGGVLIVAKGDTLYGLARRHDLVLRDLITVNQLQPPYLLKPGQRLKIPPSRTHIVAKGDTAYGIARRYGVDVYSLIKLNRLAKNAIIRPGQRLTLPPPINFGPLASPESTTLDQPEADTSSSEMKYMPQKRPSVAERQKPSAGGKKQDGTASKVVSSLPKVRPPGLKQATPPPSSGKGFAWPVKGKIILPYGEQASGRYNDGINIATQQGTEIRAAQNGLVVYVGNELPGFGNLVILQHAAGWSSAYAQCEEITVKRGQTVRKGQVIGRVGKTGNVSQPQLHFELRRRAQPVDPRRYLI